MLRRLFPFAFVVLLALFPIGRPFLSNEIFVFRDHYDYFSPLRHFTAAQLKSGLLPLWNPYNGSGERWLANPQTGVFYPPTWIFLAASFTRAYLLFLAFHLIVLGVGTYVLFRRWVSTVSGVMGSVFVTLGGPTLSLLDINNNLATFAWFPWILNAALDLRLGRPLARIQAVLLLSLSFLGGEPVLAAVASAAFVLVALAGTRAVHGRTVSIALIALVSLLLVSVQLLPFLELMRGSDRLSGFPSSAAWANSLHPRDWLSMAVAPRAPGTVFVFLDTSQTYILSLYLGGFALVGLVALAIAAPKLDDSLRRVAWVTLAMLAMVILLAAGRFLPPFQELMTAAHLNVSRYPARFAPFGAFSLVLLATLGLDRLREFDLRRRMILVTVTGLAAFVSYAGFFPAEQKTLLSLMSAMGSTGIILIVITATPRLMRVERWSYALVLVAAIDLLSAAGPLLMSARWDPASPYERIVDARAKLIRLPETSLSSDHGRGAPFEREQWLSGYLNLYLPRFDASTSAPVIPENYLRMHDAALYGPRFDLLDFLSVRYLVTTRPLPPAGYRPAQSTGKVHVYESERSLPMISLWVAARTSPDESTALRTLLAPGFDARSEILITGSHQPVEPIPAGSLKARIFRSEISPRGVMVDIYTSRPILLSVNQLDAPGWRVSLNGSEAVSLRANALFRAVNVPAGRHQIVWSYDPRELKMGAMFSALGLVLLAVEGVVRIRRRPAAHPTV